jgi:hypothetical protein
MAGFWLGRLPLSNVVIADWFATRQLVARYRITAISPSSAVLEDVSIGPAQRPDFTAQRIVVALGWSPLRPRVDFITLVGPRLRVKATADGVSFGSLDRFLPGPNDPPQRLPDLDLRIVDGRIDLATPLGPMTARVVGKGGLRAGFVGTARFESAALAVSQCHFAISSGEIRLMIGRNATRLSSRFAVPEIACPLQARAKAISVRVSAILPPALDRYTARLDANAASGAASGVAVGATRLWFDATATSLAAPPTGHFGITTAGVAVQAAGQQGGARQVVATGSYQMGKTLAAARLDGALTVTGGSIAVPLAAQTRRVAGTMAQPLLASLARNLAVASKAFDAKARLILLPAVDTNRRLQFSGLNIRSASGATLVQRGVIDLTAREAMLSGRLALSGGGLPPATLAGNGGWRAGRFDGGLTLVLGRWAVGDGAVGDSAIESATLVASGHDGVATLDGRILVSGPVGGGVTVQALGVPVALRRASDGRISFGDHCLVLDWRAVDSPTVHLDGGSVQACPFKAAITVDTARRLGGGLRLSPLALRGTVGNLPLSLSSGAVQLALAGDVAHPRLTLAPVTIAGALAARRFQGSLDGNADLAQGTGTLHVAQAGIAGPDLPVTIDKASAALAFAGTNMTVTDGSARIADVLSPARFQPLRLTGVTATLAAEQAAIKGGGRLDAGSVPLFSFSAHHDLSNGHGTASLETGNLVFGPELQPYQLAESLRGVVENVAGPINASGRFEWTMAGLTSHGTVRIQKVELATAALGPVTGIDGTLVFDDLTALTTPAGQTLRIGRINPGVVVDDGVVVFRLLGPDAVAIDSIRWPYAGGELILAPVTIRVGDTSRHFRLTVENLDAQQFLQRFEIKNLNVTGRFDGILPLVFADGRGQIVGGHLEARQGGGLIQYVGEIGGENVGASAKLAFDALRRLRYRNVGLDLDGDLDGELVTQLHFDGISEASTRIGAGMPINSTGLPFKFNVSVRAPFRALLGTAASFSDVRPLIRAQNETVQPR